MSIDRRGEPLPAGVPVALQLEVTSDCQLRCRMCPLTTGTSSTSQSPGPMQPAVFDDVLALARECGRVIIAGYGEPLTSPSFLPLLRALDDAGADIAMSTNGIALTDDMARQLATIGHLSLVNVSLDSPDPAVYRRVRVGGLNRAVAGLANLIEAMGPERVVVSAVAMTSTLPSIVDFPPLLAPLGVRRFELQSVMDYTPYSASHVLVGQPDAAALLGEIERRFEEHGIGLEMFAAERLRADAHDPAFARTAYYGTGATAWDETKTRVCHVPWQIPFIDKDGGVFPCCYAASQNASLMGRLSESSFDDIWHGEKFRDFRLAITDGSTTPDICRRCTVAPLGEHPYGTWSAVIESVHMTITSFTSARVELCVRNTGKHTWAAGDHVRVGTASPRDTTCSRLRHPTWQSPNRPAELPPNVRPQERATAAFDVHLPLLTPVTATFELVAEGMCWIPDTAFEVVSGGRALHAIRAAGAPIVHHFRIPRQSTLSRRATAGN
ncbi:MAG TPA: radical SAM protein [Acidimicrobiales bacterium]|nr:radical SAM protein [Acidimicrobiales bacterium]